jgi:phage gpG-like protein
MVAPLIAAIGAAGVRIAGGLRFRLTSFNIVKNYLKTLPEESFPEVEKVFKKNVEEAYDKIIKRTSGNPIKRRSGKLQDSIKWRVTGTTLSNIRGSLTTTSPYAQIHEFGGTIRAKNKYLWLRGGPYMNIPTTNNTGPDGKAKISSTALFSTGGRVKAGNNGFGIYRGNTKMFHLAKSVSIKKRLGFRDTANDQLKILMEDLKKVYPPKGEPT